VVINDLYIFGVCAGPTKADTELIVHADAPLARSITFQLLKSICGRCSKVLDAPRQVDLLELAQRRALHIRESCHASEVEQGGGISAPESLDRHSLDSNAVRD
jgi:hypothetical protein